MEKMGINKAGLTKEILRDRHKKSEHFFEMSTQIIITKSILPCILLKD